MGKQERLEVRRALLARRSLRDTLLQIEILPAPQTDLARDIQLEVLFSDGTPAEIYQERARSFYDDQRGRRWTIVRMAPVREERSFCIRLLASEPPFNGLGPLRLSSSTYQIVLQPLHDGDNAFGREASAEDH